MLLVVAFAMGLAGCGGPRISKQEAAGVIQNAPSFKSTKLVYLPRMISVPADGISSSTATREGEALNIIQIASIDPVVAILRARDRITIEDFVSAVQSSIIVPTKEDTAATDSTKSDSTKGSKDSTKSGNDSTKARADSTKKRPPPPPRIEGPQTSPPPAPPLAQQWVHTLRVTPRPQLEGAELVPDDGDDNPEAPRVAYTTRPIGRTLGWTLAVGAREFLRVLSVSAYTPRRGEPPGEAYVDFLWRWRSTKSGEPFDTESAEFQSLPDQVQQAALAGSITVDTSKPHWSRATLARDGATWKVTSVDWSYGNDKPHEGW